MEKMSTDLWNYELTQARRSYGMGEVHISTLYVSLIKLNNPKVAHGFGVAPWYMA